MEQQRNSVSLVPAVHKAGGRVCEGGPGPPCGIVHGETSRGKNHGKNSEEESTKDQTTTRPAVEEMTMAKLMEGGDTVESR